VSLHATRVVEQEAGSTRRAATSPTAYLDRKLLTPDRALTRLSHKRVGGASRNRAA